MTKSVGFVSSTAITTQPFPVINMKGLTPTQVKIVGIVRTEYAKKPANFDANVMAYSQGNRESWCADFASWVMLQAGVPYVNPNSGGWRIPGTYTLREYYQTKGRYELVASYQPKVGDVAIYDSKQTHDPSNNVHAAIVLEIKGDQLTTIGGNEGGRMQVSTRTLRRGENGLVGFGEL